MLRSPRNQLILSLALGGIGLVLFFGNSYRGWTAALSFPWDLLGGSLFVAAVWFCVDAVQRIPRSDAETAIAPREWQSWVGLAFCTAGLATLGLSAEAFAAQLPIHLNPDAGQAGRRIGLLFVAWAMLAYVLQQRWAGSVEADERDLQISHRACNAGRIALTLALISLALGLGFSPTERLQQLSYPWLAQLIMTCLLFGAWADYAYAAWAYWQDRRALDAA